MSEAVVVPGVGASARVGTSPGTDLFLALTPDRVLEAVERAGLSTNPVCYPLNSFENRVYEVELCDNSRVIAKFYRPGRWSAEQILEEHRFLAELAAEEIPVCPALPFPDGSTLQAIEGIYYALAQRRGGRAPDELDDAAAVRLGMLVGRLHNVGARRDAPSRLRLSADLWVREPLAWLAAHGAVPEPLWPRFEAAALAIAGAADRGLAGVAAHRLHGDLHLGNVLFRDGELRLLDFDDLSVGPAVQDLWLALPGRDEETWRQRELLLEGYERFRHFDRSTLALIEPLRGLRMVHYAAWLARRWHDPAFQLAWPEFGSEEWWRRETEDLEDQVRHLDDPVPGLEAATAQAARAGEAETLLSNRDYFWDWEGE
jgi:Ser/Thr protein kinase RdoA (MazF antagonist)